MARKAIITKYDWGQDPGVTLGFGMGAFEPQLPATNMLSLQPQLVSQVIGGSVTFTVNLGASRTIGLIHIQRLVTASNGTIRVTVGTYDSGTVNSWATDALGVYPSLLYIALGRPRFFIPPAPVVASSVSITVSGAAAGVPIQIGYVGICEILEMPNDMLIGNVRNVIDESQISNVPFGSTFVTFRAKRRRLDFGLPPLSEANGDYYKVSDLGLVNGTSSPVVVVKFPDDTFNLERNSIWGLLSSNQPATNAFYGYCDVTFQITQLV